MRDPAGAAAEAAAAAAAAVEAPQEGAMRCKSPKQRKESSLFSIQRVFSVEFPLEFACGKLRIEAAAAHTYEKKQFLALSLAKEPPDLPTKATSSHAGGAVSASGSFADGSMACAMVNATDRSSMSSSVASQSSMGSSLASLTANRTHQHQPRDSSTGPTNPRGDSNADLDVCNHLLIRSVEEDQQTRFWRIPISSKRKRSPPSSLTSTGDLVATATSTAASAIANTTIPTASKPKKNERIVAMCFSPEGDWLACLSSRKNRLHLVPILALITKQRTKMLDRIVHNKNGNPNIGIHCLGGGVRNRELMSVFPSVMSAQMTSFLRATNEAGGVNGARYHSQVAGDEEQMSTLKFGAGIGDLKCVRWWRSMNGKNYCLVGGSVGLISIVNVEENAEECRCELQHACEILAIDLIRENFRKEKRTAMLVKAISEEGDVIFYRVVLEKKKKLIIRPSPAAMPSSSSSSSVMHPSSVSGDAGAPTEGGQAAETQVTGARPTSAIAPTSTPSIPPLAPRESQEKYVIKTFPQHFIEDVDFRPHRIKRNLVPNSQLYAINDLMASESSMALFDATKRTAFLYSNFHWNLKAEYKVPCLVDEQELDRDPLVQIVNEQMTYCSSDLMLLQATMTRPKRKSSVISEENTGSDTSDLWTRHLSAWLSLPSRQGPDSNHTESAHVVHYLSLHDNEKIRGVIQSTSRRSSQSTEVSVSSSSTEIVYLLYTDHHVYECRPQWSRMKLFKALRTRAISLRDALSIGYALGIDMPSLCEVVADTLSESLLTGKDLSETALSMTATKTKMQTSGTKEEDEALVEWIHDLYQMSRVIPSKAIEKLRAIKGSHFAVSHAKQTLEQTEPAEGVQRPHESQPQHRRSRASNVSVDAFERQKAAQLLIEMLLHEEVERNCAASSACHHQAGVAATCTTNSYLESFLRTNQDYDTETVVNMILSYHQVDHALVVGEARDAVAVVLQKLMDNGLFSLLTNGSIRRLMEKGFASLLLQESNRVILRSLSVDCQVEVLLSAVNRMEILKQRDWLVRNLRQVSMENCVRLARTLDPQIPLELLQESTPASPAHDHQLCRGNQDSVAFPTNDGIGSCETMPVNPEERVELFLTVLLRMNDANDTNDEASGAGAPLASEFSQQQLEVCLKEFTHQYRPPVMVARCTDYGNWQAAACLYEAHGELIDAVECRLHGQSDGILRRRLSLRSSAGSDEDEQSSPSQASSSSHRRSEDQMMRETRRDELFELVHQFVIPLRHSDAIRASILARILVKWFEYGLDHAELEIFLIDPRHFQQIAPVLATIFFEQVFAGIHGRHSTSSSTNVGVQTTAPSVVSWDPWLASDALDDRDRDWMRQCHGLPFSGQFLFHICVACLDQSSSNQGVAGSKITTPSNVSPGFLLEMVKQNLAKNDASIEYVRMKDKTASEMGQLDPLETHAKVFSCGHVFAKRFYEEEMLPLFDKKMNALPLPLLNTKQLLLHEFRKNRVVQTPCPVCAYNKIAAMVMASSTSKGTTNPRQIRKPLEPWEWQK